MDRIQVRNFCFELGFHIFERLGKEAGVNPSVIGSVVEAVEIASERLLNACMHNDMAGDLYHIHDHDGRVIGNSDGYSNILDAILEATKMRGVELNDMAIWAWRAKDGRRQVIMVVQSDRPLDVMPQTE